MKHPPQTTILLLMVFLLTQVFGLFVLNQSITEVYTTPSGQVVIDYTETVIGPRPLMSGAESFVYILSGVALGTGLMLLIIRFGVTRLWTGLYFFAVWMSCSLSLGIFIEGMFAMSIAFVLAALKIRGGSAVLHNATEVLMYAGIAVIFVPILDVLWAGLLLAVISVYDVFAVMKSGHMVTMAKFQTGRNMFAGLMIPYGRQEPPGKKKSGHVVKTGEVKVSSAILGGGDITFPLIFSGAVMQYLITYGGQSRPEAFGAALAIPLCVSVALAVLLLKAKKDKFYPAMPVVTAGCLAGLGLSLLFSIL